MIKYDDWAYADSRLRDTYILDNGKVCLVRGVLRESGNAVIKVLDTGDMYKKPCNDLDVTPIKLGYVNVSKECFYTSRIPKRRDYRQGLTNNTIKVSSVNNIILDKFKFEWLRIPALEEYPKFSAAMDNLLKGKRNSQAFSRDFCLSKKVGAIEIHYKGLYSIGIVANGMPDLYEEFGYLKERLMRHVD